MWRADRAILRALPALLLLGGLAGPAGTALADPDEAVRRARDAAGRDEHDEAIASYRAAIEEDPSRREELSLALARQLTWAGRYEEAVEELAWRLDRDPGAIDARLALALALSWSGRAGEALAEYRRVLSLDPANRDAAFGEARMLAWLGRFDDSVRAYDRLLAREEEFVEARLGRAQAVNWRGDHRRAAALYTEILLDRPDSDEAREGRAAAWNWAGLAGRALADLERVEGSSELAAAIRSAWRPGLGASVEISRDSDDFEQRALRVEGDAGIGHRARIRAFLLTERFTKPDRPDAEDSWIGIAGDVRLSPSWLSYGSVRALAVAAEGIGGFRGDGDLHLAWLPGDRLRIDAGYGRASFFTYERSPDRTGRLVGADLVDGGVSLRPLRRTTLIFAAERGWFTDGNRRVNLRARVRHALLFRPRLYLEVGGQWLDHDEDRAGGLWTPVGFHSLLVAPEIDWDLAAGWTVFSRIDTGLARDDASRTSAFLTAGGGVRFEARRLRIELRGGRADSNLETGRGYRRSFGLLAGRVRL